MDIIIRNKDLEVISILDVFESLIWNDRYSAFGDYEIYTDISSQTLSALQSGYYLSIKNSNHLMIVEGMEIKTDVETGNKFISTGRSLESILDRRIIWNQTNITGGFQTGIQTLLNENAISPTDPNRVISRLIFEESNDPYITALTMDGQYHGDNLYDVIKNLCDSFDVGFQIILNDLNQFVFKLYYGVDRSYDQLINPYVVFSPSFDNIINTEYTHSERDSKTTTLVGGEGEGSNRKTREISIYEDVLTDLDRKEKFTDASDISSTVDGGTLTESEYNLLLEQRGFVSLLDNLPLSFFDGQVDTSQTYMFGRDFFMGDIIQIKNEYGQSGKARVTSFIISENTSGIDLYPTFTTIN